MKHKKIAVAGFAASMLIGAGTGLVLNIPGGAGASGNAITATPTEPTDTSDTTDTTDTTETTETTADGTAEADRPEKGAGLATTLAELVTAGTITQDQADAVTAAISAERDAAKAAAEAAGDDAVRPERGAAATQALAGLVTAGTITQNQADAISAAVAANHGPGGGGGRGHGGPGGDQDGRGGRGGFGGGKIAESAATALGITADELRTELEAGKTIADVATEQGIDVQTVIDAIVAEQTADITERVTDFVNGVAPTPPAAPNGDPAADPSDDTTVTTTD